MAEHLTRYGLAQRLGPRAGLVLVESAGTWGHTGSPMEPDAAWALEEYGLDGAAFLARELVAEHVVAADLVLAATREHRAAAVMLQPRAAARTYTLREFARLTATVDASVLPQGDLAERGRALVRSAAARRAARQDPGSSQPGPDRRDDDLTDPYRAPRSAFRACARLVHDALQGPLDLLAGTHPAAAHPTAAYPAER